MNMENFILWPANSLPIPFLRITGDEKHSVEPEVIVDDNFPKGRIVKYLPNQGYGYIKDRVGREILFNINELDFIGVKGKDAIKEGATIGYDICYSGRALHVKKMKIY